MLPSLFQQSHSASPPLRIGLLLDSTELPAFFSEVVDHILQCNFARLELLVFNGEEQKQGIEPPPKRSLPAKALALLRDGRRRRLLLFAIYQRWDRRNDASGDPEGLIDCSARLERVEAISVTPMRKRFVHRFPAEAVERIREKRLDVLIRFGFNILRGEILSAAKFGVWSYHHGDNDYYRGGPAYFWEVYEGNPTSGAILQVLTERLDAGQVLCKGLFVTSPGISQRRSCVQPYWGAATFIIQKLLELHQYGWGHVERGILAAAPYAGKKKIYTAPTNSEMARWLAPAVARKLWRRVARRPAVQHWRLAIRSGAQLVTEPGGTENLDGFSWIESPKGHFYADPFMIEEGGREWVFFEDFDYSTQRGKIACARVSGGRILDPCPALERPYHLSYPCVFRDRGELYMIPESGSNGTVELYRCAGYPNRWDLVKVLFRGQAVDTSVWIQDGNYWFFVTLEEPRGLATQLWLFYATTLTGEWTPNPANPISTDVRNSRGAGAIFHRGGQWFRPSQDCSRHYGYSFTLNEIVACDRDRYEEKAGLTIKPRWAKGLVATHTYSQAGRTEIIDGCVALRPRRVFGTE
ncbi:MAG: glucosamine inositolphosphorylceramide transferase family protein [Terriglobales bacterium]